MNVERIAELQEFIGKVRGVDFEFRDLLKDGERAEPVYRIFDHETWYLVDRHGRRFAMLEFRRERTGWRLTVVGGLP